MDSNHRRRTPADLQSAPFGHSGICPEFQHLTFECLSFSSVVLNSSAKVRQISIRSKHSTSFFQKNRSFSAIYACFYIIQFAKAGVKGRFVWSKTVQTTFITWSSPKNDAQHLHNCQLLPRMCLQPSPHGKSVLA